jgi:hypothetical protein
LYSEGTLYSTCCSCYKAAVFHVLSSLNLHFAADINQNGLNLIEYTLHPTRIVTWMYLLCSISACDLSILGEKIRVIKSGTGEGCKVRV